MSNIVPYYKMHMFSMVYLEDSYVLAIDEAVDKIVFRIEMVLREEHPLYSHPLPGEAYCYREAELRFIECRWSEWSRRSMVASIDAGETIDYGNIDVLEKDGDTWSIDGDWGAVRLCCSSAELVVLDGESASWMGRWTEYS